MITRAQQEILARAWREAPDSSSDPRVVDMVQHEVARIERAFADLTHHVDVHFVDHDPYQSYEEMRAKVRHTRQMLIYKGASDTPLWSPEVNWKARAVHDWDHIRHDVDFSIEGEHAAYRHSAARAPGLAPLYLSEIVLQAAVQTYTGQFDEQKLVLPGDAVVKIVNGLREPGAMQNTSMLVWVVAGWLKFMRPDEVMVHLRSKGMDLENSLLVLDAATMLHLRRL